jgi:mono/diheme cytochrome c family protein
MRCSRVIVGAISLLLGLVLVAGCSTTENATSSSAGGSATTAASSSTPPAGGSPPPALVAYGEHIFLTGTDEEGTPISRSSSSAAGMMAGGMMAGEAGCAACHGKDGRGKTVKTAMGSFETPDIRWSTLSSTKDPEGQPQTPFDQVSLARAVRDGLDPEGVLLDPTMPRWRLDDAEVSALVAYLKSL